MWVEHFDELLNQLTDVDSSIPCGMKFSREFNFADFGFFAFRGNKLFGFQSLILGMNFRGFHGRQLKITKTEAIGYFVVYSNFFNLSTCDYNSKQVRRYDSYCSAIYGGHSYVQTVRTAYFSKLVNYDGFLFFSLSWCGLTDLTLSIFCRC